MELAIVFYKGVSTKQEIGEVRNLIRNKRSFAEEIILKKGRV